MTSPSSSSRTHATGSQRSKFWTLVVCTVLLLATVVPWVERQFFSHGLTVYCAHDSIFADDVIRLFEQRTGIQVDVRYDEEANKSLGLTNLLIEERHAPRCDVFWNNQTLGTIRLKREGVLQRYRGAGYERIPARYRDPEGYWTGFAGRLRVYIVNTEAWNEGAAFAGQSEAIDVTAIERALQSDSLSDVAIAVPLFGTTLSHYTALCSELSLNGLQQWHRSLHARGVREV
ncbi:MAG: hypothetical protein KDA96_22075, partial [Planctomycetaceae bacterium]|nr:hypothetical protein [Planctomycetaceae bacterium]